MELWQTLQLGWSGGLLERGYGVSNTLEPLLLVEHIIGLQSVRLAWRGVLEANSKGRLKTSLEKVLDSRVFFLSVKKSFGCQLVTTVAFVGIQAWQLKSDKRKQSTDQKLKVILYYKAGQKHNENQTVDFPNPPSCSFAVRMVILYTVFGFGSSLAIFGNLLVMTSVIHFKQLHSPANFLIASLAHTDFLVGIIVMPFSLVRSVEGCWYFGARFCTLHSCCDVAFCYSSLLHLCFVSVDRYIAVTDPLVYPTKFTCPEGDVGKPITQFRGFCVEHGTAVCEGQDPGDADAHPGHRHRELGRIDQRVSDCNVPVNGDEAQVEERRVTECHITACVQSTETSSKVPAALYGPDHAERHHGHTHQKVSVGQRGDEKIGWSVQLLEMKD
ncbi:hypothetical protein MC885_008817 [Smutsia gigantea]|nr:hypothetical protein MC885_008817 [Smutsia gigantea]